MVKIEIMAEEVKALQDLMNDAKVPIPMGFILGSLMYKIGIAFQKEQEAEMKKKFTKEE